MHVRILEEKRYPYLPASGNAVAIRSALDGMRNWLRKCRRGSCASRDAAYWAEKTSLSSTCRPVALGGSVDMGAKRNSSYSIGQLEKGCY